MSVPHEGLREGTEKVWNTKVQHGHQLYLLSALPFLRIAHHVRNYSVSTALLLLNCSSFVLLSRFLRWINS